VNAEHLRFCASAEWAETVERVLLPWAVGARRLGDQVLEVGAGPGLVTDLLARRARRLVAVELDRELAAALGRRVAGAGVAVVRADATALPFADGVFGVAVAVNVLDHLPEPTVAIAEAHRVLAAGGTLVAATASRHDSPELAAVWRPPPSSFDAEDGPGLVASVFGQVEVERWDAPLVRLPDRDAVRAYLIARFVAPQDAAGAAERVETPVAITKRGALIYARKGS
jgi:SAM-dependent methyltransferase